MQQMSLRGGLCIGAIAVTLITAASADVGSGRQTRDNVGVAQAIVRAAFPGLAGTVSVGQFKTAIESDWHSGNPVFVSVRQVDPAIGDTREVLSAIIEVQVDGVLGAARFYGDFVNSKLGDVLLIAQKNGGDIRANVIAEMKRRGVKFLPPESDGLTGALNLSRFESVLRNLRSTRAELIAVPPPNATDEFDRSFSPIWLVKIKTSGPAAREECYDVMVDPLSLRPSRIENWPCQNR